jgi:hypothetical protein
MSTLITLMSSLSLPLPMRSLPSVCLLDDDCDKDVEEDAEHGLLVVVGGGGGGGGGGGDSNDVGVAAPLGDRLLLVARARVRDVDRDDCRREPFPMVTASLLLLLSLRS